MDNNETNKLPLEADLGEPLAEAASSAAEKPAQEPLSTEPLALTREGVIEQLKQLIRKAEPSPKEQVDALKQQFYKLQKAETDKIRSVESNEGNAKTVQPASPDPLEVELKQLLSEWRERKAARMAETEKQRADNLQKKLDIIEQIRQLTESTEDINKTLPIFRRLQQAGRK
jgi:hypothetical protein